MNYEYLFIRNTMDIKDLGVTTKANQQKHSFITNITPMNKLSFKINGEYYINDISEDETKNIFLVDFSVAYQINKKCEISFWCANVFNKDTYSYLITDALNSYSKKYEIRPRNCLFNISYIF